MTRLRAAILVMLVAFQIGMACADDDGPEIRDLVTRADALARLGVVEMGASRCFGEAAALLDTARDRLAETDLSPADAAQLTLEIEAVEQDLELLTELYDDRFYGVYPLARLVVPSLLANEGLVTTEQLFNDPDVAAVVIATRKVFDQLDTYNHPHIVFRSSPTDRRLEVVAFDEFSGTAGLCRTVGELLLPLSPPKIWRPSIVASSSPSSSTGWPGLSVPSICWS